MIFDWSHRLSRKRFEIGPWLIRKVNRKSLVADRSVSVGSDQLEWPWKAVREGFEFFRWISLTTLVPVDQIQHVGRGVFLRGSTTLLPQGGGFPALPNIWGSFLNYAIKIPGWNPSPGGIKYTEVGKVGDFFRNRPLTRKRLDIGPWLLRISSKKS